jgi:hypothetical protein
MRRGEPGGPRGDAVISVEDPRQLGAARAAGDRDDVVDVAVVQGAGELGCPRRKDQDRDHARILRSKKTWGKI